MEVSRSRGLTPVSRLAPLHYPRFRSLFLASAFSWYGDYLTLPALLVLGYQLAGQVGVAWVSVLTVAPLLVLLPIGGRLGDHGERRRRLIALDLARAGLGAAIVIGALGHSLLVVLVAVGLSRGAMALYDPGRRRLLPALLPPRLVAKGSSLLSSVGESSIVVGPALGAVLLLITKAEILVAIDSLTFLASAVLLVRVGPQPVVGDPERLAARSEGTGFWRRLLEGFGLLAQEPGTRIFAWQLFCAGVGAAGLRVYFVIIAREVLHVHVEQVGLLYLCVGLGAVAATLLAVWRADSRAWWIVALGVMTTVGIVVDGTTNSGLIVIGGLVALAGTMALAEAWGLTRIQVTTPPRGVGQAMGAILWCAYAGQAVVAAVAGFTSVHLPRATFFLAYAVITLGGVAILAVPALPALLRGTHVRADTELDPDDPPDW